MPFRKLPPGNPEWIGILEEEVEKLLAKDPESKVVYSYKRAIAALKDIHDPIPFPGAIKVSYLGPKMTQLIAKRLQAGYTLTPSSSQGSEDMYEHHSNAFGIDLNAGLDASFKFKTGVPRSKAANGKEPAGPRQKKRKSRSSDSENETAALVDTRWKPADGSNAHSLLVAFYAQCVPQTQRIWMEADLLYALAQQWGHKAMVPRQNSTLRPEQFALTGPGYIVAERCAIEKGCPRNIIVTNDVNVPWHAPRIVPPPIPEPAGLANTSSGAPLESDRYSMLFSSAAAPSSSLPDDVLPPVVAPVKPLAKKYATGQFASVYKPAQTTVTAPAADQLPFSFAYLTAGNVRVKTQGEADYKQDQATFDMMYKVEFRSKQARHPLARLVQETAVLRRDPPDPHGATEMGWLPASKAVKKCPGLDVAAAAVQKPNATTKFGDLLAGAKKQAADDKRAMYKLPPSSAPVPSSSHASTSSSPAIHATSSSLFPERKHEQLHVKDTPVPPTAPIKALSQRKEGPSVYSTADRERQAAVDMESRQGAAPAVLPSGLTSNADVKPNFAAKNNEGNHPQLHPVDTTQIGPVAFTRPPMAHTLMMPVALKQVMRREMPAGFRSKRIEPDNYTVEVLIDEREKLIFAALQKKLAQFGIPSTKQVLKLGDYVWIATRNIPLGDKYDTIILAICERKRRDDFVNCIKSETYKNQKQRIIESGIRKAFYMVEDYNIADTAHKTTFMKAMATSMAQSLIVDDFKVNLVSSERDAVNFLTGVTVALKSDLAGKSLDVIPNDWPHQGNLSGLQALLQEADPQRTYYISLDMYEVLGGKKRSIRSTWSKMIRCVNGFSEEMTIDFLEHYPTPNRAIEAVARRCQYGQIIDEEQQHAERPAKRSKVPELGSRELMFKHKLDRPGQARQLTIPASTRMWNLFAQDDYPATDVSA